MQSTQWRYEVLNTQLKLGANPVIDLEFSCLFFYSKLRRFTILKFAKISISATACAIWIKIGVWLYNNNPNLTDFRKIHFRSKSESWPFWPPLDKNKLNDVTWRWLKIMSPILVQWLSITFLNDINDRRNNREIQDGGRRQLENACIYFVSASVEDTGTKFGKQLDNTISKRQVFENSFPVENQDCDHNRFVETNSIKPYRLT